MKDSRVEPLSDYAASEESAVCPEHGTHYTGFCGFCNAILEKIPRFDKRKNR